MRAFSLVSFEKRRLGRKQKRDDCESRRDFVFRSLVFFFFFVLYVRLECVLPFEMFDNIFVGCSAVFPNRSGPVEHKNKRRLRHGQKMEKKSSKPRPDRTARNKNWETKGKNARELSLHGRWWKKSRGREASFRAKRIRLIKSPRLADVPRIRPLSNAPGNEESLMSLIKKK